MTDTAFLVGYSIFAGLTWLILFVLLAIRSDKSFMRPVIYGLMMGLIGQFFGIGLFGLLIGGMLAGYLLSKTGRGAMDGFKGGGMSGLLMNLSTLLALGLFIGLRDPDIIVGLGEFCSVVAFMILRDIMLAGIGGAMGVMIGNLMRKPR
ncbi:MAG: hypothetical protein QXU01_03010 [Candidatus Hadarchaeales archaeon]